MRSKFQGSLEHAQQWLSLLKDTFLTWVQANDVAVLSYMYAKRFIDSALLLPDDISILQSLAPSLVVRGGRNPSANFDFDSSSRSADHAHSRNYHNQLFYFVSEDRTTPSAEDGVALEAKCPLNEQQQEHSSHFLQGQRKKNSLRNSMRTLHSYLYQGFRLIFPVVTMASYCVGASGACYLLFFSTSPKQLRLALATPLIIITGSKLARWQQAWLHQRNILCADRLVHCLNASSLSISRSIRFIQEIELVSRGYSIATFRLSPITRLEAISRARKCPLLRKMVWEAIRKCIQSLRFATHQLLTEFPLCESADHPGYFLSCASCEEAGEK